MAREIFNIIDDPASCVVFCQVFPVGTSAQALPAGGYEIFRSLRATYAPLRYIDQLPTTHLVTISEPLTGTIRTNGRLEHAFSDHTYRHKVVKKQTSREAYTPLFVGGVRHLELVPEHSALPFTGGWRNCYVAWAPVLGGQIGEFQEDDFVTTIDTLHIYRHTHVRGALYTCSASFDEQGDHQFYTTTVLLMELEWTSRPPARLTSTLRAHTYTCHYESRLDTPLPASLADERPGWELLRQRAKAGFDLHCSAWPDYAEQARSSYYQQTEFITKITGRDEEWVAVLHDVTEPWQLSLACQILSPQAFAAYQLVAQRGKAMITAYETAYPGQDSQRLRRLWAQAQSLLP